jgi:hypothetical protein
VGVNPETFLMQMKLPFFHSLMQDKTLTLKSETCAGGCKAKGRLTILPRIVDVTEKLQLLIIGIFEELRCYNVGTSYCQYSSNLNASMTSAILCSC